MGDVEKKLPQYVRDLMTVGVATCTPNTGIADIARLLLDGDLESLVVLEEGHALGVVSQRDVVGALAGGNYQQKTARDVMQESVPQMPPDIPLSAAAQLMLDQELRAVFMMHHAAGVIYPAAVLSFRHLLRLVAADEVSELDDLGIHAQREQPLESFIRRKAARRMKNTGGGSPAIEP